ncbi:S9 family peptidase [Pseudonocardia oceani]|uniref:S9 family peptidase n=3 Tax=Pseudonocardia oceani TaxID=2792013 RepID=A0ABS6UI36_9PSEU|nr:prolyl oligopeptidase family serine peptidase [Pseudonocardia oceani]MBW0109863.1 S9 family peptidase [Pseudonocardia oceani]MBW0120143.1 S9 family peptidase [Pseudonocardia oceani]MBW0131563.1 S9 family peptidase [Pseudonocardia oceani]
MLDSFPRRQARTRRFTLGAPRGLTVSPDGTRVVFLRSRGGTDPVTCLWVLDVASGREHLVADARLLGEDGDLPAEERARRERSREQAGGIVGYSTDRAVTTAAFSLAGQLHVADLAGGAPPRHLPSPGGVIDPHPDPLGRRVAYVSAGALHVHDLASGATTTLARPEGPDVTHGLADFVAAEEMGRMRGFWWSPDGDRLAVARVDTSPVQRWHIADPENPGRTPAVVAYPAAGTPNALVGLEVIGLDGTRVPVSHGDDEYLVRVTWGVHGLLVTTAPRDQTALRTLRVDPRTGEAATVHEQTDPAWVDVVPGVPAHTASGALVTVEARDGAHRLVVDGQAVTPSAVQVREVVDVDEDVVLFRASTDPVSVGLWTWDRDGLVEVATTPGVHAGRRAGATTVVTSGDLQSDGARTVVRRGEVERTITSLAEAPGLEPVVALFEVGERGLRTAVLLPSWHTPGTKLPVLMDPYGGPHAQRVTALRAAHLTSQWFADQGFAVVVVDGRGTPGRGPEFEKAVHGDLASPVLEDQVDALHAVAASLPDLDLTRVGIRGWSFGGYLAALAVLRRPDVFHAAVAGAPVTDWGLYDTHYTERYLGHPAQDPDAYAHSSLIADAPSLARPLLLVHGLADDNVVAAHTLRLSSALLAAGRPHSVLPLSGVTHMTPQEVVAENLLLLQVQFLRTALGLPPQGAAQRVLLGDPA